MVEASVVSGEKHTAADIARRFQLSGWWGKTGVSPLGAQVERTTRRRLASLSSWQTIQTPLARAYYYLGPAFVDPLLDGRVVVFGRLASRTLAAPAHLAQQRPDVPGVVFHSGDGLDYF